MDDDAYQVEIPESFGELFRLPGRLKPSAPRAVVAARQARAGALLPGAPIVGAGYRSDHVTGNRGLREFEGEIDMPVWLPGESRSLREAAIAQAAALEARAARRRGAGARRRRECAKPPPLDCAAPRGLNAPNS